MRASARLSAIALMLAPVPAAAQGSLISQPSEPEVIVAAAQSCRDATTPERLDEERLMASGWARASTSESGSNASAPLRIFVRSSILLFAAPSAPGCIVSARLTDVARYQPLVDGLVAAFGRPIRAAPHGSSIIWSFDNRIMQFERMGSRAEPGVRISLIYSRSSQ